MPELPEVENLRLGLIKNILNQKILEIKINKPKLISGKGNKRIASLKKVKEFINGIKNEKILEINRRGKNLIFKLSNGKILLSHLKMSGQFAYQNTNKKRTLTGGHPIELSETKLPNKHSHIIFKLEHGTLFYNDIRMFGYVLYYPNEKFFETENNFISHGVEPLSKEFTISYFSNQLRKKSSKIKIILMNQNIVVGLGNIYTDEVLFEAGIHPERKANTLSLKEITLLHKTIKKIIQKAINLGGSSVATYRLVDLSKGNYAREHKVYGKNGNKCVHCKTYLKKILIQSRTTIFCPKCQK